MLRDGVAGEREQGINAGLACGPVAEALLFISIAASRPACDMESPMRKAPVDRSSTDG
jgi:hypothetical protein